MADIIHMVGPTRAVTEYVSKCCSFPRESTDVYQLFCVQWSVSMQSGTHTLKKLKSLTQKRRGSGARTRLETNSDVSTPIPKRDW